MVIEVKRVRQPIKIQSIRTFKCLLYFLWYQKYFKAQFEWFRKSNHENAKNHAALFETNRNLSKSTPSLILIGEKIPERRASWERLHVTLVPSPLPRLFL